MSYYWFNSKEILQKAKEIYSKINLRRSNKKVKKIHTKTCQKKKMTRLKSSKEKDISN